MNIEYSCIEYCTVRQYLAYDDSKMCLTRTDMIYCTGIEYCTHIDENTILIISSDNGCSPEANFKLLGEKGHDPSYIFRGHKADIFEGGTRVPLIIKWPRKIQKKSISNGLVSLIDFYSTFAEILGLA